MHINPDICMSDLETLWRQGNHGKVVDLLADDHPGLTAIFLTIGTQAGWLSETCRNILTNHLIDRRVAALHMQDKEQARQRAVPVPLQYG